MTPLGCSLFQTAIGACAVAWSDRGICRVWLPEAHAAALRARIRRRYPELAEAEPPPAVRAAMDAITALLEGDRRDLGDIVLDLEEIEPFHRRAFEAARAVGPGHTATYGELAERLGDPGAARAIGQAMGANPFPIVVPCHRILGAGGRLGGFSAPGGTRTKLRMLEIEGALSPGPLFD